MKLKPFGRKLSLGEKIIFESKVAEFPNGTPISLTVRAISGAHEGPIVVMLGLQHGDEYSGIEIINRLMDQLEPSELTGSLAAIPVSNPLAFNTTGRMAPESMGYENLNMNRVWPGDQSGLLTERIAAQIWNNLITSCDYITDFHEGGKAFIARYIYARVTDEVQRLVGNKIEMLYRLFGQGVPVLGGTRTRSAMTGSLSVQAGLKGIPCIGPELGGGGRILDSFVDMGIQGVKNVLIGLDMLYEEPGSSDIEQIVVDKSSWPRTSRGGILYNTCELNEKVRKGALLGVLKDTAGRALEEVRAPYDSVILDTRYQPTIYPGDWTYHCGKIG